MVTLRDRSKRAATPDDPTPAPAKKARATTKGKTKTAQPIDVDDDNSDPPPKRKKAKIEAKATTSQASQATESSFKTNAKYEKPSQIADGQYAKAANLVIPPEEHCPLSGFHVYVDGDGIIYDANLNQTNSGGNNVSEVK